ncbi:MAG TPA: N-acetyltransferase [bacterium]|nr:N-acetyltransferase [bacterium]
MLVYVPRELYSGPPPDGLFDSAERYFGARLGRSVEGLRRILMGAWSEPGDRRWSLALDGTEIVGFACGIPEGDGLRVNMLYLAGRHNNAEGGIALLDRLVRGESRALASGATLSPPPGELGPAMQRVGWNLVPRERRVLLFREAGLSRPPTIEGHSVRRLRPDDLRVLALIQAAAFHGSPDALVHPALADPFESETMLEGCLAGRFGKPFPAGNLAARRRDGTLTGFIVSTVEEREKTESLGFVVSLAVSPSQHGRGLGRLLLSHALTAYAAAGFAGSSLQVGASNQGAAALYDSLGYRVTENEMAYRLDVQGI